MNKKQEAIREAVIALTSDRAAGVFAHLESEGVPEDIELPHDRAWFMAGYANGAHDALSMMTLIKDDDDEKTKPPAT